MAHMQISNYTRFRKSVTLSMEPFSSKSCVKNSAVSIFTTIATNTVAKLSSSAFCKLIK